MNLNNDKTVKRWRLISGLSIFVMAIAAGIAYGYIFNQLHDPESVKLTKEAINSNISLFYVGNLFWSIILITDLLVSYGFYIVLLGINRKLALVSGLLRLIYSITLLIGIIFIFFKSLDTFLYIWSVGLFIFGFHLIITGVTVVRKKVILKILGLLLIVGGLGYSITNGIELFVPSLTTISQGIEAILVVPMTLSELLFALWLILSGIKLKAN